VFKGFYSLSLWGKEEREGHKGRDFLEGGRPAKE
tara:strand:- start:2881 stop:2982 length:102 start_codon:yes stop_codon:yes gene_type:complete